MRFDVLGVFSQSVDERVRRNIRLAQNASQRADLDLAMHRHYTAFWSAPHDHVASGLTDFRETKTLKSFDNYRP
jgi:hypothetical protein